MGDSRQEVYDFFLILLDRQTSERIGQPPVDGLATPHFKMNTFSMAFVLSYVKDAAGKETCKEVAERMANAFYADVYGKPAVGTNWTWLASPIPTVEGIQ